MSTLPELPEVENVRLSIKDKIINRKVISCNVYESKLIKAPDVSRFKKDIVGLQFDNLDRRGKYLIATMDFNYELIVHLGMTGLLIHVNQVSDIPAKYSKHLKVLLELDDNTFLCYCDIRKFGSLRLLCQIAPYDSIAKMGPEPWDKDALQIMKIRLSAKKWANKTIKEAIMDQNIIAGVGNIYASESLYAARIDPNRIVNNISDQELEILLAYIRDILQQSIDLGGTSISDYLNGQGKSGQFQNYLKVYGKTHCSCGKKLNTVEIKGRNTFYCSSCQK